MLRLDSQENVIKESFVTYNSWILLCPIQSYINNPKT